MKNPIKTLQPNTVGRDFIIGDLHGSYSRLEEMLQHIQFDKSKDRLISVGDLVDRGPESLRCLELLYEPWFHATLANHEQMMLEAFDGGYMGMFWLRNGGMWGSTALSLHQQKQAFHTNANSPRVPTDEEVRLYDLLPMVRELPLVITVEQADGSKVHVIHAELPPGSKVTDAMLADPMEVLRLASHQSDDGDYLVWGRHLYYNFYNTDLSNRNKVVRTVAYTASSHNPFTSELGRIVSGHTIVQRPLTILGQTNIDTCAYGSYKPGAKWEALTCLEVAEWKFHQVGAFGYRQVEAVRISEGDIQPYLLQRHK